MSDESKPRPPPQLVRPASVPSNSRVGSLGVSQRTPLSRRHVETARHARDEAVALGGAGGPRLRVASHVVVAVTFGAFAVEAVVHEALLAILEEDGGGHYFQHHERSLVERQRDWAKEKLDKPGRTTEALGQLLSKLERPALDPTKGARMDLLNEVRNKLVHPAPGDTRSFSDPSLRRKQLEKLEAKLDAAQAPCVPDELQRQCPDGAFPMAG
jgi:hypothetical protein